MVTSSEKLTLHPVPGVLPINLFYVWSAYRPHAVLKLGAIIQKVSVLLMLAA